MYILIQSKGPALSLTNFTLAAFIGPPGHTC